MTTNLQYIGKKLIGSTVHKPGFPSIACLPDSTGWDVCHFQGKFVVRRLGYHFGYGAPVVEAYTFDTEWGARAFLRTVQAGEPKIFTTGGATSWIRMEHIEHKVVRPVKAGYLGTLRRGLSRLYAPWLQFDWDGDTVSLFTRFLSFVWPSIPLIVLLNLLILPFVSLAAGVLNGSSFIVIFTVMLLHSLGEAIEEEFPGSVVDTTSQL